MAEDYEEERKNSDVRARQEAVAASKKGSGKKGFKMKVSKKKLVTFLRKKFAEDLKKEQDRKVEELKKEQERKAEERKRTIAERCGPQKKLDDLNEAALQAICKEYHQRILKLEDAKYDLEFACRQKEFAISELNMAVNDLSKIINPPLKRHRYEYGKFEKLKRAAAKKADNDFEENEFQRKLKFFGPSQKFKLENNVKKKTKPDWALVAKKAQDAGGEE